MIDFEKSSKSSLKLKKSSSVHFDFDLESSKKLSSKDDKTHSLDDVNSYPLELSLLRKSKSFHNILAPSIISVYYTTQEFPETSNSNNEEDDQPSQPLEPILPAPVNPSKRRVQEKEPEMRIRGKIHGETCTKPLSEILEKKKKILKESRKRDQSKSPGRAPYQPKLQKREVFEKEPKVVIIDIGKFQ